MIYTVKLDNILKKKHFLIRMELQKRTGTFQPEFEWNL
jgi:hypothetical protein